MSRVPTSRWHTKAKWMLKKVLLKPPSNADQLRNLCQSVVTRRYGTDSTSTAVMTTALSLWEDPNLVNALHRNQTFLRAKERIQNLSSQLLPPSASSGALSAWTSQQNNQDISNESRWIPHGPAPVNQELLHTSHGIIMDAIDQVLSCPVCGKNLQCLHDNSHHSRSCELSNNKENTRPETTSILPDNLSETSIEVLDSETEPTKNYTEGTAGKIPPKDFHENVADWFGPLVLASFAIVGLALGVFQGEIVLPKLQSVTSRAVVAVKLLMQASNSIFKLVG